MSQHTPGPLKSADCGCLYSGAVQMCRTHAIAPEMLRLVKDMLHQLEEASAVETGGYYIPGTDERVWFNDARALLAKVEGNRE